MYSSTIELPKSGATRSLLDPLYRALFGGIPFTFPTSYYVALWCSSLDVNSTYLTTGEVSADSYQRVLVENTNVNFTEIIGTDIRNAVDIVFPPAGEDWGIVTHMAIMSALIEGNMLYYSELATPKEIISGDQFKFPISSLRMVLPIWNPLYG